ncbi:hypothetical protein HDV64DRAFT_243381 [Trichoderma sp. TUCIM 5745]
MRILSESILKTLRKLNDGSVVVQLHWLKRHGTGARTCFGDGDINININNYMQRLELEDNTAWGDTNAHRQSGLRLRLVKLLF